MDLHSLASNAISGVNPLVLLTLQISLGYTTGPDGSRTPAYAPAITGVQGQLQPMAWRDIQQTEGLNLQGTRYVIYIGGAIDGLVRPDKKGGDLITTPDGRIWLVAMVLESWPDWCKVAVVLQTDGSNNG